MQQSPYTAYYIPSPPPDKPAARPPSVYQYSAAFFLFMTIFMAAVFVIRRILEYMLPSVLENGNASDYLSLILYVYRVATIVPVGILYAAAYRMSSAAGDDADRGRVAVCGFALLAGVLADYLYVPADMTSSKPPEMLLVLAAAICVLACGAVHGNRWIRAGSWIYAGLAFAALLFGGCTVVLDLAGQLMEPSAAPEMAFGEDLTRFLSLATPWYTLPGFALAYAACRAAGRSVPRGAKNAAGRAAPEAAAPPPR